ncbi:hypothetical protein CRM22_009823 [Opisthorchis felineus]|uniref:CS domain-containing protein n=1 Tax=Opisthorchis felineus TaxID=147828 RepID=A0A4S2L513_OPIFE|nr:hypothetical protein CRM22_009823 [Opisthorchis felineus]
MDQIFTKDNILALQNLLRDPDESESESEEKKSSVAQMKPSDIGPKPRTKSKKENQPRKIRNPDEIWDVDEVPEGNEYGDIYDPRPQPEYELFYKQSVTTEDIYLQMGMKNPTTASCEFLVARIRLPGCKKEELKLDVKEKFLDLRSPQYKLGLHLPNPVDPNLSKADWDEKKEVLEVTMKNKRQYDFMNE